MKTSSHIFILLIASIIFFGCKKDHDVLGVDAQPSSDALGAIFSDTAKIYAHTIKYDSIPSFNDRYKYLGSNQDPHFGRTDIGLYTNANIPNSQTGISFGADPNLVSAEIILTVASLDFLGTYSNSLSYSVFPVTSFIDKNIVHYANHHDYHNPTSVLGTYTGTYSILSGKLVLRIPIDYNYANSILTNPLYVGSNSVFQNNYKGFFISSAGTNLNPVSMQGVITKFDMDDELSGFYLYYQNGTPSASKENKTFHFTFSGVDASRFNAYKYDLNTIPNNDLYKQIVNKDSTYGVQNLFLKGMGGTRLKVFIPSLKNYSDSFSVAVNRAEVIFNLDPSFVSPGGIYFYPQKYALLPIDEKNRWHKIS